MAVVVVVAMGLWQMSRARVAALAEARQGAGSVSHALAQHAERTLQGVDRLLAALADDIARERDRSRLTDIYDGLDIGPHGVVTLSTTSGRVLVRRPAAIDGRNDDATPVSADARPSSGVIRQTSAGDGVDRIVAVARLRGYPLVVSDAVGTEEAPRRWRSDATLQIGVLALACLSLIGLAWGVETQRRAAEKVDRRYRLRRRDGHDLWVEAVWCRPRRWQTAPRASS